MNQVTDPQVSSTQNSNIGCVIVHYRSPDTIVQTLSDLRRHLDASNIIVVDNSQDLNVASLIGQCAVIDPGKNLGYAAAVNVGIRHLLSSSKIDRILVATHETRFPDESLPTLIRASQKIIGPSIVAPILVLDCGDTRVTWSAGGTMSAWGYPKHLKSVPPQEQDVLWVDGAAYIVDREAWKLAGPVPEEFFLYVEDVAFGYRARDAGVRVVVTPEASVTQSPNGPSRSLAVRNRLILIRRYLSRVEAVPALLEFWSRTLLLLLCRAGDGRENIRLWREATRILRSR